MVSVFLKGSKKPLELMTKAYENKTIEISQWFTGGGGKENGKLKLYGPQNNRIHSSIVEVEPNQAYTISIKNLKDKNFYFTYGLLQADKSTITSMPETWIKDQKEISVKISNDTRFLIIFIGSDDVLFGIEAVNNLVQVSLSCMQAVQYVRQSEFEAFKSEINALKKQIGG